MKIRDITENTLPSYCKAKFYGDTNEYRCTRCAKQWSADDHPYPECSTDEKAAKQRRIEKRRLNRAIGNAQLHNIRKELDK